METRLFSCIARINNDLLLYNIEKLNRKCTVSTRSQGGAFNFQPAPIIFSWCFKWEESNVKHEMTFEIWKGSKWVLRSEHNTEEKFDFANPLKGEFLFSYSFDTLDDMLYTIENTKEEFFKIFQKRINL